MWAELVGMSLSWEPGHAVYIPVKGPLGAVTLDVRLVRKSIGPVLADPAVEKVGQNLKYDLIVLANAGFDVAGPMFDTMVAAHVLDSTRPSLKLDNLAAEYLNHRCIPIEDVIGRGPNAITMDAAPLDIVVPYAAEDADVALRLADVLAEMLRKNQLTNLFTSLEMPLLPVLTAMELRGIIVDPRVLNKQAGILSADADALRDRIVASAGRPFNPIRPSSWPTCCSASFICPPPSKRRPAPARIPASWNNWLPCTNCRASCWTNRKTDQTPRHLPQGPRRLHTSADRQGPHLLPPDRNRHRKALKQRSEPPEHPHPKPRRQKDTRRLRRRAFWKLLSADYSQVELRVLAHLCEDPTLMAAFAATRTSTA